MAFLALIFGPTDRLPIGRKNQSRAGIGNFDAVAAELVDIQKEGLLDGVMADFKSGARTGFGVMPAIAQALTDADVQSAAAP